MIGGLRHHGVWVDAEYGDGLQQLGRRLPYDLCILKSHTDAGFIAAAAAAAAGNDVINRVPSVGVVRDKATTLARLAQAGLPTPASWLAGDHLRALERLRSLPIVVKPVYGDLGRDVFVLRTQEDVRAVSSRPTFGPVLVQEVVPARKGDLKVYGIGERLYAVRKRRGAMAGEPGRQVELSTEARLIGERVRDLFGLELFGVDVMESPSGLAIVDVNHFPGYAGLDEAGPALVHLVLGRLRTLQAA
jgi:ribosomal protein S6--L-glutamate ligase